MRVARNGKKSVLAKTEHVEICKRLYRGMEIKMNGISRQDKALVDALNYMRSVDVSSWNVPYAVTLRTWYGTSKEQLRLDVKHLLNCLDYQVYKNAFKKHGKRLRRIGVIEGSESHPHYHLLIESPGHLSDGEFRAIVRSKWSAIRCGQTYIWTSKGQCVPQFDMTKVYSTGWKDYISKLRTKESVEDVDFINWHLNHISC